MSLPKYEFLRLTSNNILVLVDDPLRHLLLDRNHEGISDGCGSEGFIDLGH